MNLSITNSHSTIKSLQSANAGALSSQKKIASGAQYSSVGDNAAAYAILTRMYSNIGTTSQSNTNTQTMNSLLSTAGGAMDSTVSSLGTLQSKLLQAANGTNSPSDIEAIRKEIGQTVSQLDENAGVSYNGKPLLTGSQTLAVASDKGYQNIGLSDMSAKGLGLVDSNGNSTLDLSSPAGLSSALDTVSNALDTAISQQTSIGATQQGLSYASANYTTAEENLTASASTIGDTNVAKQVTQLKSANTIEQMALYASKLNMHRNADVLSLLG